MQKINIFLFNKYQQIIKRKILRTNLKNYVPAGVFNNRNIWMKPKLYQKIISKVVRKISPLPKTPAPILTKIEYSQKLKATYSFPMWRYDITKDDHRRQKFLKLIKKKYELIKNKNKYLNMQKLGIELAGDQPVKEKFYYAKTKRNRTTEIFDVISTIFYERDKKSTEEMFKEIEEKIRTYYLETKYSDDESGRMLKSLKKDDTIKVKRFFITFQEQ